MENVIKTIFMGTPEFATKPLLSLINNPKFLIQAVFTNPDEKIGRKQTISAPPVKKIAENYNLPFYQPLKIREAQQIIKDLKPDLIIVVAYGHLIPKSILDIPKYGCINIHGSLLPKYRGSACMQAPILNGDKESGITIMEMEAGLDTGPILRQAKIELAFNENIISLGNKLSELSAEILIPTLESYIAHEIKAAAQDNAKATYVKMIRKEDGQIDFTKSALEIERMVRAYFNWPGAWFNLAINDKQTKKIKILQADSRILAGKFAEPGQFFKHNNELGLQCGQDALTILSLQIEGKMVSTGYAFMNGHRNLLK